LDLAAFDSEALCRAVADFPLPVLTAIGHEVDETVLDMVAHTRLKTPTAAADWLIRHNMHFEMELQVIEERLREAARFLLQDQRQTLERLHRRLHLAASHRLQRERLALDGLQQRAQRASTWLLQTTSRELATLERQLALLRPEHTMRRGFTLTTLPDGRLLRSAHEVEPGTPLQTHLPDGIVHSRTTDTEKKE
ncbi:MAG: exodeoxyribonuclease VII large subunit, partial [Bacteroidetes bacterium]